MLVQRCTLEQHRLILPVSVSKPALANDRFNSIIPGGEYRGLVDTGAQRTVISRSVIAELELTRTGHMQFASLHGARTHSRYLAGIGLWAARVNGPQSAVSEQVERTLYTLETPLEVVDMDDNSNFDLIIGFDILKSYSFAYDAKTRMFDLIVKP